MCVCEGTLKSRLVKLSHIKKNTTLSASVRASLSLPYLPVLNDSSQVCARAIQGVCVRASLSSLLTGIGPNEEQTLFKDLGQRIILCTLRVRLVHNIATLHVLHVISLTFIKALHRLKCALYR